jgi:plasmid maintenance system antidote protein VapI
MEGEEFKALLEEARLTSRALAEWMGYASHTVVTRMIDGRKPIHPDLAQWIRRRAADAPPRLNEGN